MGDFVLGGAGLTGGDKTHLTAADVRAALRAQVDPEKAILFPRFFKAGPGEYAEGDRFLGVTVPQQRQVAKKYRSLSLSQTKKLLTSPWHEDRLTALFILVGQYTAAAKAGASVRKTTNGEAASSVDAAGAAARQSCYEIYEFYMAHTAYVDNWDLVDSSAPYIVGAWLAGLPEAERLGTLHRLAASPSLWERRIAMLATFYFIRQGRPEDVLEIAGLLLHDKHDLIQKAVGWMLRETGKRVDRQLLVGFLERHAATMPRTTLRYAIEHFDGATRRRYMALR